MRPVDLTVVDMARAPHPKPPPFHPARPGLVRPIPVSPETGLTRGMARGRHWRTASNGLYVPTALPDELAVEQRIAEAAMVCPPDGAITGWAALRWLGAAYFSGTYADQQLPVPIVPGRRGFQSRPGVRPTWERLLPDEIIEVDGVHVTIPEYSATFEARHAGSGIQAVQALDMAMMFDLTSLDELVEFRIRRLATTTGIAQLDAALSLSSENCWSPPEATMRVLWAVDRPECNLLVNRPVFDLGGRPIGTPDLIDPVAGVLGQYNGAPHDSAEQRSRDAEVNAAYAAAGLEVVTMTAADLPDGYAFLYRLDRAYLRARRKDRRRGWTTALPTYWTPTHTVAQRRALDEAQRVRLLGWQRLASSGSYTADGCSAENSQSRCNYPAEDAVTELPDAV